MNLILTPDELYELMYGAADNALIEAGAEAIIINPADWVNLVNNCVKAAFSDEMPVGMAQLIKDTGAPRGTK